MHMLEDRSKRNTYIIMSENIVKRFTHENELVHMRMTKIM